MGINKKLEEKVDKADLNYGDLIYLGGSKREVPKEVVGFIHWYQNGLVGLTESWPCYLHHEPTQRYLGNFSEFRILKRAEE